MHHFRYNEVFLLTGSNIMAVSPLVTLLVIYICEF